MGDDIARPPAQAGTAETVSRVTGAPAPARGEPGEQVILAQDFDVGSLFALRAAFSPHAAAAGLAGNRLYDVVTVAHELAANAVRHGAGQGRLRLWIRDRVLHCEVSDAGPVPPVTSPADEADRRGENGRS